MRIYIMRHGETAWNQRHLLQGRTDISLNENGRALARATSRAMKEIPFDLCITSPLSRAKETAGLVLEGRNVPVREEERIQEISFGPYEGRCVRNEKNEVTDPVFYNFFHRPELYLPPEGAESLDALCARTGSFLEELAGTRELFGKTILISTHGAASRALLAYIRKTPRAQFWGEAVPKNCAVTIAEVDGAETPCWIVREQDKVYYENS